MINPKVFRQAATLIDVGWEVYACWAIRECFNGGRDHANPMEQSHQEFFAKWFKPDDKDMEESWWARDYAVWANNTDKEPRILALLLAERIAMSERKKSNGKRSNSRN